MELFLHTNVRYELKTVVIDVGSFLHGGITGIIYSHWVFFYFDVRLRFAWWWFVLYISSTHVFRSWKDTAPYLKGGSEGSLSLKLRIVSTLRGAGSGLAACAMKITGAWKCERSYWEDVQLFKSKNHHIRSLS